jgi:hypothetical protein
VLAAALPRLGPEHHGIRLERTPGVHLMRAARIPFLRLREVVYHHVDLDAGFTFVDVEPWLVRLFVADEGGPARRERAAPCTGGRPALACPRHPNGEDIMSYTGHVVPGGPTDTRVLGRATIRKMSVSEMHNNVYLDHLHGDRRAAAHRRR